MVRDAKPSQLSGTYLDHDGHLPKLSDKLLGFSIVDTVLKDSRELAAIGDVPLPALGREDFAPFGKLVGRRNLSFLENDTLVPDRQLVPVRGRCALVSVEERLGANLGECIAEQAGLPVVPEQGIEGLNMRVHGLLEGRIRGSVGRGVSEEPLSANCVVFVIPRRVGAFGGHFGCLR